MVKYENVDDFIQSLDKFQSEAIKLREILCSMEMEETVKWSFPTYVDNKKNIVGIFVTKSYFGLWFFQGVFLSDPAGVLINAQKGKTQALRQWRMYEAKEIKVELIKNYVTEAIENQRAGLELKPSKKKPFSVPKILKEALNKSNLAKSNFEAFTPSKRREFCEYISEAKRASTKETRLAKIIPMIENAVGLNDKYRPNK